MKKLSLGVAESKLASAITECFPKIKVRVGTLVQEINRGIRTHFYKMVKGLTDEAGKLNKCIVNTNEMKMKSNTKVWLNRKSDLQH